MNKLIREVSHVVLLFKGIGEMEYQDDYKTEQEAQAEAKRLAACYQGKTYIVAKCQTGYKFDPMQEIQF